MDRQAVLSLIGFAVAVVPVTQILHRVGYNRWWAVLWFLPLINLISLWVFAFKRWPIDALQPTARDADQWSDADHKTFRKLLNERSL